MATRYYLRGGAALSASGLPTSEQSPDTPHPSSLYGISGTVRYLYDMLETPNSVHSHEWTTATITPPTASAAWAGWWKTRPLNSGTLAGGTLGFYIDHGDWSNAADQGFLFPRFHVYQWRPGVGKVTSLLDPTNGVAPANSGSTYRIFSSSFPYSGATIQTGDHLIFELWASSSFSGPSVGASQVFTTAWNGFATGGLHTQQDNFANKIASWIEFQETLPEGITGSAPQPSTVYITAVRPHVDSNKLKVFFSAPVDTGSVANTSFLLDPHVLVKYAAPVAGTDNTEFDLHFGNELESEASTFALWRFDEEGGSVSADEGAGGFNLTNTGVVRKDGLYKTSRQYNGTSTGATSATGSLTARNIFLNGNFTVEALVRITGTLNASNTIVSYAPTNENEGQVDNYLFWFYINANRAPVLYWEQGAGVDQTLVSANPVIIPKDQTVLLTARVVHTASFFSTNTRQADVFFNGKNVYSVMSAAIPDGGTNPTHRFGIARSPGGAAANFFPGFIDSVRITSGAKTDLEINSSSLGILYPLTRGQVYTLTSTGIRDPNGLTIQEPSSSFTFQYLGNNASSQFLSGNIGSARNFFVTGSAYVQTAGGPMGLNESRLYPSMVVDYDAGFGNSPIVYTPPVVQNIVPAPDTVISPTTPIQFEIVDASPFRRILVVNNFSGSRTREVFHDGDNFGPLYTGSSNVRSTIAGGYRYVMLRDGGWPESPIMTPYAIDITGSENL